MIGAHQDRDHRQAAAITGERMVEAAGSEDDQA
jgi:hypothetical protein